MSTKSPCLLTLPPAEIHGLALTQFRNCGRSQRQSRTRQLAAWVEAPTHRAEAASSRATETQRDAAAPRLPASSSPSSERPRQRCGFPAGPLTALAAQCSKRALSPRPRGPREEDMGSRGARTLCGCRSSTSKSQTNPRARSPLQPLRFCPTTSVHVTGVPRHCSA